MQVTEAMVRAMFPDAVEFRRVQVRGSFFNAVYRRDEELPPNVDADAVKLERITESPPHIYAGMSERFRTVLYYECEEFEEYPDE